MSVGPIPAQPLSVQPAGRVREGESSPQGEDSFARLLERMLAPPADGETDLAKDSAFVPTPPPVVTVDPAVSAADIAPSRLSPADPDAAEARELARIFNQAGFFPEGARTGFISADLARTAELGGGTAPANVPAVRPAPAGDARPSLQGAAASLLRFLDSLERGPGASTFPAGAAGSAGSRAPSRSPVPRDPPARPVAAATMVVRGNSSPQQPAGPEGRARPARPPSSPDRTAAGGSLFDTQLSLSAAGAEASLVARVQALTREEQARLRHEIIQLLARHGWTAGTIRLNGEVAPVGRTARGDDS